MAGCACAPPPRQTGKSHKRVDLGKDLMARGQDAAAETELKKALIYDPKNEEAANLLGLVYMLRANRNINLVEYEDCRDDTVGHGLRNEADDYMRTADQFFEQAIKIAETYGEAWQNRAVVAMYFKDWSQAVRFSESALSHLARLTSEPLARANLGWSYHKRGDHVRARRELLQAMQREPTFCLGAYRLAQVFFDVGDIDDARERIESFLEDPRQCPLQQAQYLGSQLFLRVNRRPDAKKALATCIQMAPKSCKARECATAQKGL